MLHRKKRKHVQNFDHNHVVFVGHYFPIAISVFLSMSMCTCVFACMKVWSMFSCVVVLSVGEMQLHLDQFV